MKKGLLAGAALALALAAPVTVFAEESTPSVVVGDASVVLQGPFDSNGAAVYGQSVATALNEAWGLSLDQEYTIVWVGEAVVMENGKVVENYGPGAQSLTVSAANYGGDLFIHHKKDGSNDVGATITLKSEDLSPVVVVKKVPMGGEGDGDGTGSGSKAGGTANTGDSNNTGLWAGALVVSALLAGAAFVMNKRNA